MQKAGYLPTSLEQCLINYSYINGEWGVFTNYDPDMKEEISGNAEIRETFNEEELDRLVEGINKSSSGLMSKRTAEEDIEDGV